MINKDNFADKNLIFDNELIKAGNKTIKSYIKCGKRNRLLINIKFR